MKTKRFIPAIALLLFIAVMFNLASCSMDVQASDLMQDVTANTVKGKEADDRFIANSASFSVELFKRSVTKGKNSLISPASVLFALAMTANGADKETLAQMQTVLSKDIPIDDLNEFLYYLLLRKKTAERRKSKTQHSELDLVSE